MHAVNRRRYPTFFPELLYNELNKLNYDFKKNNIYEVYSHATILVCFNDMKVLQYKSNVSIQVRRKNLLFLFNAISTLIDCMIIFPVTIEHAKGKELKNMKT